MNCDQFRESLAEFVGGELPASQRAQADEHCASCANCREIANGLMRAQAAVAETQLDAPEAAIRAARIPLPRRAPSPAATQYRLVMGLLRYAAVIVAAFGAGYWSGFARDGGTSAGHEPPRVGEVAAVAPAIEARFAANYRRAATAYPQSSSLGLALMSLARE
ncbi:MAG: zf-HC2 domain-containing protein [Phycisphaerae bacterium]